MSKMRSAKKKILPVRTVPNCLYLDTSHLIFSLILTQPLPGTPLQSSRAAPGCTQTSRDGIRVIDSDWKYAASLSLRPV